MESDLKLPNPIKDEHNYGYKNPNSVKCTYPSETVPLEEMRKYAQLAYVKKVEKRAYCTSKL